MDPAAHVRQRWSGRLPATATVTAVDVVIWVATGLMLVLAVVCVLAALGLPLERAGRIGTEVAEALLFLVVGADLLAWAAGNGPDEPVTHVGYAIAAVAVIPLLTRRPKVEDEPAPEPPSMWVLAIAAAAISVILWRLGAT